MERKFVVEFEHDSSFDGGDVYDEIRKELSQFVINCEAVEIDDISDGDGEDDFFGGAENHTAAALSFVIEHKDIIEPCVGVLVKFIFKMIREGRLPKKLWLRIRDKETEKEVEVNTKENDSAEDIVLILIDFLFDFFS